MQLKDECNGRRLNKLHSILPIIVHQILLDLNN